MSMLSNLDLIRRVPLFSMLTADQAKQSNDFLAVIDADPASPAYGKLLASVGTDISPCASIIRNTKCPRAACCLPMTTIPISR